MARAEDFPTANPGIKLGIRPKGSNQSKTGIPPGYPLQSNQLEPHSRRYYIFGKQWVNDYITRKNKMHTPPPPFKTDHSYHSFIHPLFCSNFLNLKQPVFMVLF